MNRCWSGRDLIEQFWVHNSVEITLCNLTPHIINTMVQKALVWTCLQPTPHHLLVGCSVPSKSPGFRGWSILIFVFLYSLWDLIQVSTWILCLAEFTRGEQQRQMSKQDLISVKRLRKEKIKGILCFCCTCLYYQQVIMMAKSGPPGFYTWLVNPEKPGVTRLKSVLKPNSPWHLVFLFGFAVVFVFAVWAF